MRLPGSPTSAQETTGALLNMRRNLPQTSNPVLDYAIARCPPGYWSAPARRRWYPQEHLRRTSLSSVPSLAPAKLAVSLYIVTGTKPAPECTTFSSSLENSTGNWVKTEAPAGAGTTSGVLGYMFWAAECPP